MSIRFRFNEPSASAGACDEKLMKIAISNSCNAKIHRVKEERALLRDARVSAHTEQGT